MQWTQAGAAGPRAAADGTVRQTCAVPPARQVSSVLTELSLLCILCICAVRHTVYRTARHVVYLLVLFHLAFVRRVGRLAILKVHTRKLALGASVDLERLASLTAGCSGADLNALANEAAIRTVRRAGAAVEQTDFEDALKTFYAARGMTLQSMGEVAAGLLGLQR